MIPKSSIVHRLCLFSLSLVLFLSPTCLAAEKKLVLLPLAVYADQSKDFLHRGLRNMFSSRLSGEDIVVLGDQDFQSLLEGKEKEGIISPERAEELAGRLGAGYAIFGSVTAIGAGYSMDLAILDLTGEKPRLTRVSESMKEDQFIPKLGDVAYQFRAVIAGVDIRAQRTASRPGESGAKGIFFRPSQETYSLKPTGSIRMRMDVMAFDMGDLDGDGQSEMVVLSRKKAAVYGRKGKTFALLDTLEPSMGEDFLKVSVGDGDRNGRAEIYLVSRYGKRARTTVWEWTGKLKMAFRMGGHLRTVKGSDGRVTLLLFQDSGGNEFFSGKIWTMKYAGPGKLTRGEPLNAPNMAQFYTLCVFDLDGDGRAEYAGLGETGFGGGGALLYVWNREGAILWNSEKKVGGTNNVIHKEQSQYETLIEKVVFESRIVVADVDKDGKRDLLAIEGTPMIDHLGNFKVFDKSRLIAYKISGKTLVPSLKTGNIKYCLTDMQVDGETLFLAAQKGRASNVGQGSGRVMWFE